MIIKNHKNLKSKSKNIGLAVLDSETLIDAYCNGYFPMAESDTGEIYWHFPKWRAVIPIYNQKIPRSMKQILNKSQFDYRINTSFIEVIKQCANRQDTWISEEIIEAYTSLHLLGYAHSVETWENGELVGGLYGVAIGAAFFGESMFNKVDNASKAAFYFLCDRLREREFFLLDSQYLNPFTKSLGAIEIRQEEYLKILREAIITPCKFD